MMLLFAIAAAGCLSVAPASDRILGADLVPSFPPEPVALAPMPGVVRVFRLSELRRLAGRFRVPAPDREICVTRLVAPLAAPRLLEAMQRALPHAEIQILDFSRQPAPEGEIEFSRTRLPAGRSNLWTGYIRYAANHKFTIWAKVKVTIRARRILATHDIPAGKVIQAADVESVTRDEFPNPAPFAASVEDVVGKSSRQPIRAGAPIRASQLVACKEVARGDTVVVDVRNGAATLELEAIAETAGAIGETILLRNPASKRSFRARVEAKGLATVIP